MTPRQVWHLITSRTFLILLAVTAALAAAGYNKLTEGSHNHQGTVTTPGVVTFQIGSRIRIDHTVSAQKCFTLKAELTVIVTNKFTGDDPKTSPWYEFDLADPAVSEDLRQACQIVLNGHVWVSAVNVKEPLAGLPLMSGYFLVHS